MASTEDNEFFLWVCRGGAALQKLIFKSYFGSFSVKA